MNQEKSLDQENIAVRLRLEPYSLCHQHVETHGGYSARSTRGVCYFGTGACSHVPIVLFEVVAISVKYESPRRWMACQFSAISRSLSTDITAIGEDVRK